MAEPILTHDAGVSAFADAETIVETDDEDGVTFSWDEDNIVRVDAPADLSGAFDTDRFYKIEGATIARPIKQPYFVEDEIQWYKKPAEELQKAAWSFDNAPFTLGHPDTGMVKSVDDIHGFWRNPRYDDDEERLKEDLYIPVADDEALSFVEDNQGVSVGFYNRLHSDYDGNTGDLSDDDVDGFQVDMYGNHIAGVEQGRCSAEHGCGLDSDQSHGEVIQDTTMNQTTDAPSGIHVADGKWFAVGPDEHTKDSTDYADDAMFPVDSCSDVEDAWGLRGHTDNLTISQETLANRIERVDEAKDCGVTTDETEDSGLALDDVDGYHPWRDVSDDGTCSVCGTTQTTDSNMGDNSPDDDGEDSGFDLPDLAVDAIAEQNDAVQKVVEERDSLREDLDEMRTEIEEAFDEAEHFSVELAEDECPCEAVEELVDSLDEKVDEVEDLRDELSEYREDEIQERLDTLDDLGADRDEWESEAEEADDPLSVLDEEIERREEVLDAVDDTTVKDIGSTTDSSEEEDGEQTIKGTRRFGRGHSA